MEPLEQELKTITPDLMNITRLFGLPDSDWDPPRFSYTMTEDADALQCVFTDGRDSIALRAPLPPAAGDARLDALHRRRTARRLCRQTLYALCRDVTGIHPPWGSLTGIRPTRLMYELLEQGLSLSEAPSVLIRRFDLTAEKAHLLQEVVGVQRTLPPPGDEWADVYIGIPFCRTRCTYCSFSSGAVGDGKLLEPYLEALFAELDDGAALLRETGRKLRALYIGGGTPTALDEAMFRRLLERTAQLFPGAAEYTVEAGRPDTITRDKLQAARDNGFLRISINPQSMVDRTLQVIGRAHTAAQVEEAYALARQVGFDHINMDVIAGLPGESADDFAVTMAAAKRLRPESLTVHTLAIKHASQLHLDQFPLPPADEAARMTRMGQETAHGMGMQAYYLYRQKYMAGNQENVGYALPGHACLYNVDIMEENTHILAFGAGGISKRIYPEEGHIGRSPNVSNIEQYIARHGEMAQRKRALFLGEDAEG